MSGALIGLGGVVLGAFLSYLFQLIVVSETARSNHLRDAGTDLTRIEECAFAYWLQDGALSAEEERARAARLRALVEATTPFRSMVKSLMGADAGAAYLALDDDLYLAATGGEFEVVGHEADPDRAIDVSLLCHDMRTMLRAAQRRVFAAR